MSVEIVLLFALAITIVYSLISGWLNKTILTLPIVFTGLGYLVYSPWCYFPMRLTYGLLDWWKAIKYPYGC